jgi:sRNA-binding regulator protein Hfq
MTKKEEGNAKTTICPTLQETSPSVDKQMTYYARHREECLRKNAEYVNKRNKLQLKVVSPYGVPILVYKHKISNVAKRDFLLRTLQRKLPNEIIVMEKHRVEIYFKNGKEEKVRAALTEALEHLTSFRPRPKYKKEDEV